MAGAIQKEDIINITGLDGDVSKAIESLKKMAGAATELSKSLGDTKGLKELNTALKTLNQVQNEFAKFQSKMVDIAIKNEKLLAQEAKTKQENIKIDQQSNKTKAEGVKILEQEEKVKTQAAKTGTQEAKTKTELARGEKILNTEKKETIKLTTEERLTTQLLLKEEKLRIIINNSLDGSYDKLDAQLKLNIITLQKMSEAERATSANAKQLVIDNKTLVAKLNDIDKQSGRTGRSFNGLQWQVTQLARELPSLAYGANVFFGAIGNNLPMLIDELNQVRTANKLAAEQGRTTVPAWKQMASSILSWQTALIVAITLLTVYGRDIVEFGRGLFGLGSSFDAVTEKTKRFNDAQLESKKKIIDETHELKIWYGVSQDATKGRESQIAAINILNDLYPSVFRNFTQEEILAGKAKDAYLELASSIEILAIQESKRDEIKKLANERAENERKKEEAQIKSGEAMAKARIEGVAGNRQGLPTFLNPFVIYQAAVYAYQDQTIKKFDKMNGVITERIETVKGELKGGKDLIDPLGIARAKKEFEEFALIGEDSKKIWKGDYAKDGVTTYKQWLEIQLEGNDNLKQRIELEKELKSLEKKDSGSGGKSGKSDAVKEAERLSKLREDIRKDDHKIWLESEKDIYSDLEDERKKDEKDIKDGIDDVANVKKYISDKTVSDAEASIHEEMMLKINASAEEIKNAKGNADKIREIQEKLEFDLLESERKILQAKLDSGLIIGNDAEQIQKRINAIEESKAKKGIDITTKTDEEKKQIAQETMQATNALLQQGLDFSQQIYSAQAMRAQEAYNAEIKAAGDNLEAKTLADRKFEEEDKKIKKRQAIADKLQAIFNAGLNLALAIGSPNIFAKPILIAAATLGLATAVATPLPQFADGVENFEGGLAVLGDGTGSNSGKELVTEPSGRKWLSSGSPSVYNLASGSSVTPADETRRMLAAMAFDQVREVIDMSETNSHLSKIAKNTKNSAVPYTDNKGRTVIKRGSLTTTL